jgi:hypothetical protein
MAGAGLFWEKSTAGWLLVAGLLWEKKPSEQAVDLMVTEVTPYPELGQTTSRWRDE